MADERKSWCVAAAWCLLLLAVAAAGCTTDLTRGRDYGNPPLCEVHGRVMTKRLVPLLPGYDLYGPQWAAAMQRSFPHSDSPRRWDGDITVHGDTALDYICPACNQARDAWLIENRPEIARAKGLVR